MVGSDILTSKKDLSERESAPSSFCRLSSRQGGTRKSRFATQVYFTNGRIFVKGNKTSRGERKFADFILYYKPNSPIAVIEAKDNNHSLGAGMQQALGYAEALDIPLVYSSNGDGFLEHDRTAISGSVEREHFA